MHSVGVEFLYQVVFPDDTDLARNEVTNSTVVGVYVRLHYHSVC